MIPRRNADSYPHPIDERVITNILNRCKSELQVMGIELYEMLGCGDYGCAFLLSNGRVAKFTKSKKEADAAYFILNHPNPHKSLPRVDNVLILEDCHKYEPLYIILRESLDDLSNVSPEWFSNVMDEFEYLLNFKAMQESLTDDDIYEKLTDIFDTHKGKESDEIQVEELADLFVWNIDNNVWLDDIIEPNWGQRTDGTIVIRDLGAMKLIHDN